MKAINLLHNKKLFIMIIAALIFLSAGVAVALNISEKQPEPAIGSYNRVFIEQYVAEKTSTNNSQAIPRFSQDDILTNNHLWSIGADAGELRSVSFRTDAFEKIVQVFSAPLVRKTDDNIYLVYDTDTGERLFLFFDKEFGLFTKGYCVIMKQLLQFSNFADLKIGSPIKEVEMVDPVIPIYVRRFNECTDQSAARRKDAGLYFTSVHLLSDGILKIEYERIDNDYFIKSIVYSPDFVLDGLDGKTTYKILKDDYVN